MADDDWWWLSAGPTEYGQERVSLPNGPGFKPGRAHFEDKAPSTMRIVHFGNVSCIWFCYVACLAWRSYVNCALRTRIPHLVLLNNYANCTLRTRIPRLMLLNNYANCALRIRILRLTVLCCLPGVAHLCELSILGHLDWKVAGGAGCNGKYFA